MWASIGITRTVVIGKSARGALVRNTRFERIPKNEGHLRLGGRLNESAILVLDLEHGIRTLMVTAIWPAKVPSDHSTRALFTGYQPSSSVAACERKGVH